MNKEGRGGGGAGGKDARPLLEADRPLPRNSSALESPEALAEAPLPPSAARSAAGDTTARRLRFWPACSPRMRFCIKPTL